jgi:hypothetical protein
MNSTDCSMATSMWSVSNPAAMTLLNTGAGMSQNLHNDVDL